MKRKPIMIAAVFALSLALMFTGIGVAQASSFHLFSIGATAPVPGGSGWYSGYFIQATTSGAHTYTLTITAKGANFPLIDANVVMLISKAAYDGGITQITITDANGPTSYSHTYYTGSSSTDFTPDPTGSYGPIYTNNNGNGGGGPFKMISNPSQPGDYYAYNHNFPLQDLDTWGSNNQYSIQVTITFASTANSNSKIWFGVIGHDTPHGNGGSNYMFTPFSEGVLFVLPEYTIPLMGIGASFAAFAVFKKLKH